MAASTVSSPYMIAGFRSAERERDELIARTQGRSWDLDPGRRSTAPEGAARRVGSRPKELVDHRQQQGAPNELPTPPQARGFPVLLAQQPGGAFFLGDA